jgi:epoxyqueuosine reductase QueG
MTSTITVGELRKFAETFVAEEPARLGADDLWQTPLLATAPVDSRFDQLPQIAADDHVLPRDLLASARSVIVFYIPFKKDLVKENRKSDRPCLNWGLAYVQTNDLIGRLTQALGDLLAEKGFKSALTPATHNFDEVKLMACWSHKHLAHLVNLGRFGIHHMMITPVGSTGRLGSLVSEAALGDHPLIETQEACLLKVGKECGQCIKACPVDALSEDGFERRLCWVRLTENRWTLDYFADLPESTHVCGKCVALLPCSFKNPMAVQDVNKSS